MSPKVWTFTVCWNEALLAPWFVRHYSPWVDRMVIWDERSTDGTREILKACPKVDLRDWHSNGLDDEVFMVAVNEWTKEAQNEADYVAFVDIDELLYHPNMLDLLDNLLDESEDIPFVIPATGYALINPAGLVSTDLTGQVYDHVRTGVRQPNYDKRILWRSDLDITQAIGRHYYPGQWPKHNGVEALDHGVKLLHLHHLGGVEHTMARNARNYLRARDKKYAWNFDSKHNHDPNQSGSLAWVKDAMDRLLDVFDDYGKWIQLGSGGLNLSTPWRNFDMDMDITRPLPFSSETIRYIVAGHVIEHITPAEAWAFLKECARVLMPGGVLRLSFPDITRLDRHCPQAYRDAVKAVGHGDGSKESCIHAVVCSYGHKAVWTPETMWAAFSAVGLKPRAAQYGESSDPVLRGVDLHHRTVGMEVAKAETSVMEGVK